jgi:anhydro-N-acetylmuramic acid kinase
MEKKGMLVLGLMSGTSADGIDVALARVEEEELAVDSSELIVAEKRSPRSTLRRQVWGTRQARKNLRTWGAAVLRPYTEGADRHPALKCELVAHATMPMNAAVRKEVLRVAERGACTAGEISQLNFRVGEEFAAAAIAACRKFRVALSQVQLIGSHGQTIFHQGSGVAFLGKKTASTLQIGEPSVIAARTGIPTVGDFRVADMAAGGQGAPLVPYVDWLLLRDERIGRVALNLGGIGNVTVMPASEQRPATSDQQLGTNRREEHWRHANGRAHPLQKTQRVGHPSKLRVNPQDQVMAFDTGPGNMVIDALVAHFTKGKVRFDRDARMARKGRCVNSLLEELLKDPYLKLRPPKSTGREYFGKEFVKKLLGKAEKYRVRAEDMVRTATVFTALSVVDALNRFVLPRMKIEQVIVSGGGAHNPLIMGQLAAALEPIEVFPSSRLGVPEDAKEAYAFALLAYETWHRRAGNLPSATGARKAVVLGKICY